MGQKNCGIDAAGEGPLQILNFVSRSVPSMALAYPPA